MEGEKKFYLYKRTDGLYDLPDGMDLSMCEEVSEEDYRFWKNFWDGVDKRRITKLELIKKELKKTKTINTIARILLIISIVINFFTLIGNVQ